MYKRQPEVNATGTYELVVTLGDNGCTASDIVEVMQDASLPLADAGPSFEITCNVMEGNLDGSGSTINNDITYEWNTTDGIIVSGETTLTPLVNAPGIYQLTLTNTTNGCTAISSCILILQVGIEEISFGKTISFTPNPTNDKVIISISEF